MKHVTSICLLEILTRGLYVWYHFIFSGRPLFKADNSIWGYINLVFVVILMFSVFFSAFELDENKEKDIIDHLIN